MVLRVEFVFRLLQFLLIAFSLLLLQSFADELASIHINILGSRSIRHAQALDFFLVFMLLFIMIQFLLKYMIKGMIFDFDIVNFPFLDGDVPRRPSYGVYISQLIRFARASSHVGDFNNRNKFLTAKLLKQGYRYHKLRKALSKFYRRHFELIEKYHVSLKKLMQQGISNPEFGI